MQNYRITIGERSEVVRGEDVGQFIVYMVSDESGNRSATIELTSDAVTFEI